MAVQIEEVYERNQQQDKLRHEGMGSKVENTRRPNAAQEGRGEAEGPVTEGEGTIPLTMLKNE